MRVRKFILKGLAVLLVIGIIAEICAQISTHLNYRKAERVGSTAQSFPKDYRREQVIDFLESEGLTHEYVVGNRLYFYGYDGRKYKYNDNASVVLDNGYALSDIAGYVRTIIPNTHNSLFVDGETAYYFSFDRDGRLLEVARDERFTGL